MSDPTPTSEDTMTTTPSQPAPDAPRAPSPALIEPSSYTAPMPTEHTIRMRKNLPVQAWRFAAVSLKMTRMIIRSHG
jgi:hypothetical protein